MKPILESKNGSWKQNKHQKAAESYFKSMSWSAISNMADQLVLGEFDKLDWFDEEKDPIFIRHLTDLVMEADEFGPEW